ncbi:VpaChn25_0724 family phage protein [Bradyrhizobium sp. HKCCYLR20261]|uniref:VpaChn25_0724 family phage protein n=1 Tax=Bradyrhizobium sp. HKCCYLR20261 TaxID=3420760 RepID=UPI003EB7D64E
MARDIIREDARLIVLRELHAQPDYRLNDNLLQQTLELFGIAKSRDWVREELNYLENVGAITKTIVGTVVVAHLTPKGVEHVERRLVIEGVKRPSPPER